MMLARLLCARGIALHLPQVVPAYNRCGSTVDIALQRERCRQPYSVVGTDAPHECTGSLPVNTCKPISLHVALHEHRNSMSVMCASL
jgi:hypothetical protein